MLKFVIEIGESRVTSRPRPILDRLQWMSFGSEVLRSDPGTEVIQGLASCPKTLPCRYFYDDEGSRLFEQITEQPEYYLTRTELSILETYADAIAQKTGPCDLIELGSGSSTKTRRLLTAYSAIDPTLRYCPIDVSAGILKDSALSLLKQYPLLNILGMAGTYEQAMQHLPAPEGKPRVMVFLGSTLGNMSGQATETALSEQGQFFEQVRTALRPGDYFLLGVDLQKPVSVIEAAYNDAQGITAKFNLNILTHLNREFLGNFERSHFEHLAKYNSELHQIEMLLLSAVDQSVELEALAYQVSFQAGEMIRTEISRKFDVDDLNESLAQHDLSPIDVWHDSNRWFALILCQRS